MSRDDLDAFCARILDDVEGSNVLRVIEEREEFKTRLSEMGRLAGFEFSADEIEQVMRENHSVWLSRWA